MERDEFLKSLGLGLALVCTGSCFEACKKSGDDPEPGTGGTGGTGTTASVDISSMTAIGSQAKSNGVLFFRVAAGSSASSFVATQSICPHAQGGLNWVQADNKIVCDTHASAYSTTGTVLNQPVGGGTTAALKVYALTLNGTTLTATKS